MFKHKTQSERQFKYIVDKFEKNFKVSAPHPILKMTHLPYFQLRFMIYRIPPPREAK